ncbi:type II toxin-antitoxin system RelE/ParE family toxin [Mucilaginibacter sp. OK098]|uniref:type II toxin-antitoxin system RelE/ParE family toxin n=1 Tax=Mucilaginibacter sp. OK098 TaxID=1855297 RepID=UPI00091C7C81|nr:type II toxin-antitoxin system RelE/ParE family toxin [Mucilaginibacter sp. OK098]SHN19204.1 Plasmid stabilization system protein ParE [Mucilaginibacter sp. OK098]
MAKEVILTPIAQINYEDIIEYLLNNWGLRVTNNFIDRFEKISELLVENPEIFPFINKAQQIQKCVLTKHNIIYFKNTRVAIKILTVFDTRQNPDKLSSII